MWWNLSKILVLLIGILCHILLCISIGTRFSQDKFPVNRAGSLENTHIFQKPTNKYFQTLRQGASQIAWNIFQERNKPQAAESQTLRYFSPQSSQPYNQNNFQDYRAHTPGVWIRKSQRRKYSHPMYSLTPDAAPQTPIELPVNKRELPFNQSFILSPSEMVQILDRQNYNPRFMSFSRPRYMFSTPKNNLKKRFPAKRFNRLNKWLELLEHKPSGNRARRETQRRVNGTVTESGHNNSLTTIYERLKHIANGYWVNVAPQNANKPSQSRHRHNVTYTSDRGRRSSRNRRTRRQRRSHKRKKKMKSRVRRMFRNLLRDYTMCPVHYYWRDFGQVYWPRWIKQGMCVDFGGTSCSIPPGQFCTEAEFTDVTVLRYFCIDSMPKSSCRWYRTRLPVLMACKCGCSLTGRRSTK